MKKLVSLLALLLIQSCLALGNEYVLPEENFVVPKAFLSQADHLGVRQIKNFPKLEQKILQSVKTEMECDEWSDAGFGLWKAEVKRAGAADEKAANGKALVVKYFSPCEEYSASTGVLLISPDSVNWFLIPVDPGYNLEASESVESSGLKVWRISTTEMLEPTSKRTAFEVKFRYNLKNRTVQFVSVK